MPTRNGDTEKPPSLGAVPNLFRTVSWQIVFHGLGRGHGSGVTWGMGCTDDLAYLPAARLLQRGLAPSRPRTGAIRASGLGITALIPLRSWELPWGQLCRVKAEGAFWFWDQRARLQQETQRSGWPESKFSLIRTDNRTGVSQPTELSGKPCLDTTAAAAAAKSLLSCPTLCDPIDSSPGGSPSLGFSGQEHCSGLPFPSPVLLDWKSQEGRENIFYYSHYLIHA